MQADSWWKRSLRRLRYWLARSERQRLLWEEMEFHIESMVQDLVAQGTSEPDARPAARKKFGNMTQNSEEARSVWIARWMSDLAQDLRQAFRGTRRDAGFTTFVILIAGLGIGASSTIFSVVNALLLRPLPFRDPGRLVWIANEEWSTQVGIHLYLRERNQSFSDLAGFFASYGVGDSALTGTGEPERLTSVPVIQNFFPLLGVQPKIGRSFTADECQGKFRTPPAALLSHGYWQRRFASDPGVVGRKLTLNNKPVMVVGVLPASFDFASVFAPGTPVDLFIPWPLTDETNRYGNTMKQIGRLRPGATAESAQAEFTLLAKQIWSQHPEWNGIIPRLTPLSRHVSGRVSPALIVLACAVGVLMVIVCANLSNLQLARLGTRQKEMAVRAALGAGRLRLLRQMLTESVALSCCGAALGMIIAVAGTRMTQDGGRRVVGVDADVRHEALEKAGGSEMYFPMRQTGDYAAMNLVMRTVLPPEGLAAGVRAALRKIDPNLPVREFRTLQDLVDKAVSPRRFLVVLLAGFAGFALLLASLGIYAVISYSVNQRAREIGIRMALGASATSLQNRILLQTLGLAALGLALGMAASRALTGALESLLFGVTPGDPVTFIGIGALLVVVAALAGYLPLS